MKTRLAWLAGVAMGAGRLAAQSGPMLYPRSPAAPPVPHAPAAASGTGAIALVILLGIAAGWLWWRRWRSALRPGQGGQQLVIAETRALGNRQFLVVAACGERRFLLGVCPGRIELLASLDGGTPPRSA